jgi:CarboxypepD_reg-like domain
MADKKIILYFLISLTLVSSTLQAQVLSIRGKITDSSGKPVVAASITLKNANRGTSSDLLGIFSLQIKPKSTLLVSAIGFVDTTFIVYDNEPLNITLATQTKAMKEVVISKVNREQILAEAIDEFMKESAYRNSTFEFSSLQNFFHPNMGGGVTSINRANLNYGVMLPVFSHKEDAKGSRYLLSRFVGGIIIDQNYNIIADSMRPLNYDKIDRRLMVAVGDNKYLAVDKEKVIAFAFKVGDTSFVFLNVPILNNKDYFLLIATGPKYSAFKLITTKFTKSSYQNNGLVETGNNFDEFVDEQTYYYVDQLSNKGGTFELKKKSIMEVFTIEKEKTNAHFAEHTADQVNDQSIGNFITYLNKCLIIS